MKHPFEFYFNLIFEFQGIELEALSPEPVLLRVGQVWGVDQPLEGSLGGGVLAQGFGAAAKLAAQFEGGAEEVMEQTPGAIEVVDQRDQLGLL